MIVDILSAAVQLTTNMYVHLLQLFRLATQKANNRMFSDFMAFLVAARLLPSRVDVQVSLVFMEYLCQKKFSSSKISNYLIGIRAYFVIYDLPSTPFGDKKIPMFICVWS